MIQFSNSQGSAAPVLCGAGTPSSSLFPSAKARGWRARAARHAVRCRTLSSKVWRLSARHRGFFCPRGRSFRARTRGGFRLNPIRRAFARLRPRRVQPLKADPRSGAGRLPGASRERGYVRPRPQAPHFAPSPKRLAKTPSMSKAGARTIIADRNKVKKIYKIVSLLFSRPRDNSRPVPGEAAAWHARSYGNRWR